MKKLIMLFAALMTVGCSSTGTKQAATEQPDQGGVNACQFAKERIGVLSEDIASIEVVKVDTLMSDIYLGWGNMKMLKSASAFLNDKMSRKEYKAVLDSMSNEINNVTYSWQFGSSVNDSLRNIEELQGCWRKVYTISVKMKSGTTKEIRVMMDNDGIKPRMTESEMVRKINEISHELDRLYRHLINY